MRAMPLTAWRSIKLFKIFSDGLLSMAACLPLRGCAIWDVCQMSLGMELTVADLMRVCDALSIGREGGIKVPFLGRGNIWVQNSFSPSVVQLTRAIIYQALERTAPGQLSVVGYDSNLSGIFAPFASLSAGERKQFTFIGSERELSSYLGHLRQDIRDIQNVIQGRSSSLLEFRSRIGRPVEGYQLVVLSLELGNLESKLREELKMLFRAGPAAGISFLLVSTTNVTVTAKDGKAVSIGWRMLAPNTELLSLENGMVVHDRQQAPLVPISSEEIIQFCEEAMRNAGSQQMPTVRMDEIQDFSLLWGESSAEGLTFTIGKYGINDMSITIGDEVNQRHNAVITGAVGQGKSNLISVIVHSLCQRYSPDELRLYMLDFKEGVSLKPYANIGQEEYLPHAAALGLESDVNFGVAVLESLFEEYKRRMQVLKSCNARSIRELRQRHPEIAMPRILAIIDEFQMMFEDDQRAARKAAELLEKSVRLFRAAGIHFILASQTLSGNVEFSQHRDNIFSQIPIRIALKNSVRESQETLSLNNTAAAFLRPREAIVNLDYGEPSQNQKTVIAFADEKVLVPLRHIWWERARSSHKPPYVFERNRRAAISSMLPVAKARCSETSVPAAFLGERIAVDGSQIAVPLPDEPGRNIAIIGTPDHGCNNAQGMLQSAALSLAMADGEGTAQFLFCDFTTTESCYSKRYPAFAQMMQQMGHGIEDVAPEEFEGMLLKLLSEADGPIYLFGAAMDRWIYERNPYGGASPLKELVDKGPAQGVHFLGWWSKEAPFTEQTAGIGQSAAFNTKVFLRIDERSVQSLTSPFTRWSSQENRALISDPVELEDPEMFVPFAPVAADDISSVQKEPEA